MFIIFPSSYRIMWHVVHRNDPNMTEWEKVTVLHGIFFLKNILHDVIEDHTVMLQQF